MIDADFIGKSLDTKLIAIGSPRPFELEGFSIDSRAISPGQCFVAIPGDRFDGHNFIKDCYDKGVRYFIAGQGARRKIKKMIPEGFVFFVDDTIEGLGKLASHYKKSIFASVTAITGSSGKTTTRDLLVKILSKKFNIHTAKKNYNNEIGLPLTILDAPMNTHVIVLEMGMNHKGEIKRLSNISEPLAAMITNVGYAHIGSFGSLEAIAGAKAEIFGGMNRHGFVFLNRDDQFYQFFKELAPGEVIDFGASDLTLLEDKGLDGFYLSFRGRKFDFKLPGIHNLANLAGAIKVAQFYGVETDEIIDVVGGFLPVLGRSEVLHMGITIINDCYNANPSSMMAGLSLLGKAGGRRVAVLSDMLELGALADSLHTMVGNFLAKNKLADLILGYGDKTQKMLSTAKKDGIAVQWFKTKEELMQNGILQIKKGDTVLVKASHGMGLDAVVDALVKQF